jgi:hypothetical protein
MVTSTRTITRWTFAVATAGLLCMGSLQPSARAANCDEDQNAGSGDKQNYRTVVGPDGRKTFVIEKPFVVCGKVPKPTVIYALQASSINYEWETLNQEFLPKVLDATRKAPF